MQKLKAAAAHGSARGPAPHLITLPVWRPAMRTNSVWPQLTLHSRPVTPQPKLQRQPRKTAVSEADPRTSQHSQERSRPAFSYSGTKSARRNGRNGAGQDLLLQLTKHSYRHHPPLKSLSSPCPGEPFLSKKKRPKHLQDKPNE